MAAEKLEYTDILVEKEYPIGYVTINRPERLNAISPDTREQLNQAFAEMRDDSQVRVFILKGAGDCFCSGLYQRPRDEGGIAKTMEALPEHLEWMKDVNREPWARYVAGPDNPEGAPLHMEQHGWWWDGLWENPKPSIALVHSYCLGAGMALANGCDIVYATPTAVFSYPPIRRGASIVAAILPPWLLGHRKVMWMALTGEAIDVEDAYNAGLITKIVPEDELEERAKKTALSIAKVPPATNMFSKRVVNSYFENPCIASTKNLSRSFVFITENSAVPGHYFDYYNNIGKYGFREANRMQLEKYGGEDEVLQKERARLAAKKGT